MMSKPLSKQRCLAVTLLLPTLTSLEVLAQAASAAPALSAGEQRAVPAPAADTRATNPAPPSSTPPTSTQPSAAQPSATQPSATQPSATQPSTTQPSAAQWDKEYARARGHVADGSFSAALPLLTELEGRAPDGMRRQLAAELHYVARRLSLLQIPCNADAEDDEPASATNRGQRRKRSTDEISWLYLNSAFYGMGSGLTASLVAEANSAAAFAFPMVIGAGAAIGTVALLDRGSLYYGVPQAVVTGMHIGAEEGILALTILEARDADLGGKDSALLIWAPATLGMIGAGLLSHQVGTTPGQASYVHSAGLWTGLTSVLLANTASDNLTDSEQWQTAAVGYNVGLIAGLLSAGYVAPRISRVRFLDLGALAGGFTAGGILFGAEASTQVMALGAAAGGVGGIALAWWLTRDLPQDRPDDLSSKVAFSVAPVQGGARLEASGVF